MDSTNKRLELPKNKLEQSKNKLDNSSVLTIFDPLHSDRENRFILIGSSHKNRLLVIVHTERKDKIRIISARKATKKVVSKVL